jgi:hypothetical protein
MPLLLLCLGAILASAAQRAASRAPLCPPRLGLLWRRGPTFPAALRRPLRRSAPWPPLLHHPSQVTRSRTRSSPSATSRPARQRMPSLAARIAAADHRVRAQAVLLPPSEHLFQTLWFHHLLLRHCHEMVPEPSSYPARRFLHVQDWRAFTASTDTVPIPSTGTATEVGVSPVESFLHPWLMVKPVGCTLSTLYSNCI